MSNNFGLDPAPGLTRLTLYTAMLLVLNGPKANQQLPLHQIRIVVGRNDPPHVTVDLDLSAYELGEPPMISRRHAILQWVDRTLQIIDLASRNGTFVNGVELLPTEPNHPSPPAVLNVGSKIVLGNLELEVITRA